MAEEFSVPINIPENVYKGKFENYSKVANGRSCKKNIAIAPFTRYHTIYKPLPYTFKISNSGKLSLNHGSNLAKCPPFHVQLDHTLAVIWSIFAKDGGKKPIGVAQLQWALNFLKGIVDQNGKHPRDVNLCIDIMEEALLQKYADMADSVKPPSFDDTKLFKNTNDVEKEFSENTLTDDFISLASEISDKPEVSIIQNLPFSVTYADMVSKRNTQQNSVTPPSNITSENFPSKYQLIKSEYRKRINQHLKSLKSAEASLEVIRSGTTLDPGSSHDLIREFLQAWRKEQVKKIQEELRRLHAIELFIESVHKNNFTPYLDTSQLDLLIAEKVKKHSSELNKSSNSIFLTSKTSQETKSSTKFKTKE